MKSKYNHLYEWDGKPKKFKFKELPPKGELIYIIYFKWTTEGGEFDCVAEHLGGGKCVFFTDRFDEDKERFEGVWKKVNHRYCINDDMVFEEFETHERYMSIREAGNPYYNGEMGVLGRTYETWEELKTTPPSTGSVDCETYKRAHKATKGFKNIIYYIED